MKNMRKDPLRRLAKFASNHSSDIRDIACNAKFKMADAPPSWIKSRGQNTQSEPR